MPLRVALFVEGTSQSSTSVAQSDPLARLWNDTLCEAAGVDGFSEVVGISKKHLVLMSPDQRGLSGAGEPLDELIARKLTENAFDAAVVAWDLHPRWKRDEPYCRWNETLDLYRGLANSAALPPEWVAHAAARLEDLSARETPSARNQLTRLEPGAVHALCMEQMFESILLAGGEQAIRRAMTVDGTRVPNWPSLSAGSLSLDRELQRAIVAVRKLRPQVRAANRVRGDFVTMKHEWAKHLLDAMLSDDGEADAIRSHPIAKRLGEIRG